MATTVQAQITVQVTPVTSIAVSEGSDPEYSHGYPQPSTLRFSMRNTTKNMTISNSDYTYSPSTGILTFNADVLSAGDQLYIYTTSSDNSIAGSDVDNLTVKSTDNAFEANFTEKGGIDMLLLCSVDEDKGVAALLYDENMNCLRIISYSDNLATFEHVDAGDYTVVTMYENNYLSGNIINLIGEKNYVMRQVRVDDGVTRTAPISSVPELDVSGLDMLSEATRMEISDSEMIVGSTNQVSATAVITRECIKKWTGKDVSVETVMRYLHNIVITFDLPEGCEYVDNSGIYGYWSISPSIEGRQLIFRPDYYRNVLNFYIRANTVGRKLVSGKIDFDVKYEDTEKHICVPIGSCTTNVKEGFIEGPSTSNTKNIYVNGKAEVGATVKIYDGEVQIGTTTVNGLGNWSAIVPLNNPTDKSVHNIFALVLSPYNTYFTNTFTCTYSQEGVSVHFVKMTHFDTGTWQEEPVVWTFPGGKADRASYPIWCRHNFTFTTYIESDKETINQVKFIVHTVQGVDITLSANYSGGDIWSGMGFFYYYNSAPNAVTVRVTATYQGETRVYEFKTLTIDVKLDPQGYVYECVKTSRIEGVQAVLYEQSNPDTPWDGTDYEEVNPQTTDKRGVFQWFVPEGNWQVRFSKEGFEPTQTEWLPVPPPQLDVPVAMTRLDAPKVASVVPDEDFVVVNFDRWMLSSDLHRDNVEILDEDMEPLPVSYFTLLDEEEIDIEQNLYVTSRVKLQLRKAPKSNHVTFHVDKSVRSYAGTPMGEDFYQEIDMQLNAREFDTHDKIYCTVGQKGSLRLSVLPAEGAAGKTLRLEALSSLIYSLDTPETITLDEQGQATIVVSALIPGESAIKVSVEGTDISDYIMVHVSNTEIPGAIEEVHTDHSTPSVGTFGINGQRISAGSTLAPGIYIQNGKKILVR